MIKAESHYFFSMVFCLLNHTGLVELSCPIYSINLLVFWTVSSVFYDAFVITGKWRTKTNRDVITSPFTVDDHIKFHAFHVTSRDTKFVQKVSRLKLYLPGQKKTMNETILSHNNWYISYAKYNIQARGVMVIVVGNGHGDTSSNPGQDGLHFT